MRQGRFHGRRDHEGDTGLAAEIQHADAIRPNDTHTRIAPNVSQTNLGRDIFRAPGFRKARRIHHQATDTGLGAIKRDFFHRILGGDHNAAIGHFRQCGNRRVAGALTDFLIPAIRQMQPARIARQRADGAIRKGTRARGSADYGNRGRVEQPLHISMAINAAMGDGHCLASSCSAGLMRQSGL